MIFILITKPKDIHGGILCEMCILKNAEANNMHTMLNKYADIK